MRAYLLAATAGAFAGILLAAPVALGIIFGPGACIAVFLVAGVYATRDAVVTDRQAKRAAHRQAMADAARRNMDDLTIGGK